MLNGKKIVAVCTARLWENSMHELIVELNKRLIEQDCGMFIGNLCSDEEWLKDYMSSDSAVFELFDYDVVDLVVMMDEKIKNKAVVSRVIEDAFAHNIPVISVDSSRTDCITVNFDFEAGFEKVVRHVVEHHGIKDVHMMAGSPGNPFSEARIQVFKDILSENQIPFTKDMISYGYFWSEPARVAARQLLIREQLPKAIICANDVMAINVCAMFQEAGYRVPEDVVVTGFDGIDEIFSTEPKITSCMCDCVSVADKIADIIEECFDGDAEKKRHLITPEFIGGGSCGCSIKNMKNRNINSMNVGLYRFQDTERALACIAERIQMAHSLDEIVEKFDDDILDNLTCFLNKNCLDPNTVLEDGEVVVEYDDTFVVVRRSHVTGDVPYEIARKDIYESFEDIIDLEYPIVVNALGSMNRLLGFVCFYYDCADILSYAKIPSILNALSNGIRGYLNVQRQIYLSAQMEKLYAYDSLTGLYNRMGFNRAYDQLVERLTADKGRITVILSDLDGLKAINDQYGHILGDQAIVAIADALKTSCPEDALCVRLGGDEMLAVITGDCDSQGICKAVNEYLNHYNATSGLPCKVATSLGVFTTDDPEMFAFDRLIIESDKEMYKEKQIHHGR